LRWILLFALAALAGQVAAQADRQKSDWEQEQEQRDFKENEVKLPAWPKDESMIEFFVSGTTSFRFFIDPASLSVAEDGVVRYTLVARSPAGANNVSHEGIRCVASFFKVFAYGSAGRWSSARSGWKPIGYQSAQRWHYVLRDRFFCPLRQPIHTAAEGLNALRQGLHPVVRDYDR